MVLVETDMEFLMEIFELVTEIQKSIAGLIALDDKGSELADSDGSGVVNIKDATAIQKKLAKID